MKQPDHERVLKEKPLIDLIIAEKSGDDTKGTKRSYLGIARARK